MTGSWVGYVYAIAFCGLCVLLLLACAAVLVVIGRIRARSRPEPRVNVLSVSGAPSDDPS
jgi:hypothetical protein